jgi:hypothetical protein
VKSPSKRGALWAIGIVLLLTGTIEAQLPPKAAKIGFLMSGSGSSARLASFRREFLKLGYVEGKNVTLQSRAPISITTGFPPWLMNWSSLKLT